MEIYCQNCGRKLEDNDRFCSVCGAKVEKERNVNDEIIKELYKKERVSLYFWIAVASIQGGIGILFLVCGVNVTAISLIGMGCWNGIASYGRNQFCQQILKKPVGIYKHYEEELATDIIFLILNLVLGGIVGAIAAGYDLYVRSFALEHKEELINIELNFAF